MRRTEAGTGFAVEILVKEHEILPVRIVREARVGAVAGPASVPVAEEDAREAVGELARRLLQGDAVT